MLLMVLHGRRGRIMLLMEVHHEEASVTGHQVSFDKRKRMEQKKWLGYNIGSPKALTPEGNMKSVSCSCEERVGPVMIMIFLSVTTTSPTSHNQVVSGCFALGAHTNHNPLLLHPLHKLALLGTPRVRINPQNRRDSRLVLLAAVQIPLVGAAHRRDRRRRRVVPAVTGYHRRRSGVTSSPCLLQHGGVHAVAVLGGNGRPEAVSVGVVDGVQTAHVDNRLRARAVQTERAH